jgi:aminoglycoside phosphotransferase family enzyme
VPETAQQDDTATADVLEAFRAARAAGRPPVECYRAGVEAWRQRHPDQAPEYAAKRAVAVILAHSAEIKIRTGA